MPFGLSDATFMCLMNDVLCPYLDWFVIVYLDNILIFSYTWVEHVEHLKKGLETLRKNYLLANIKKCGFSKNPLVH
jgi:hypothetical protein